MKNEKIELMLSDIIYELSKTDEVKEYDDCISAWCRASNANNKVEEKRYWDRIKELEESENLQLYELFYDILLKYFKY